MGAVPQPKIAPTTVPRRVIALVGALAAIGLALTALAVGFTRDPTEVGAPLVGRAAPSFRLAALDGTTLDLASLRGHPVILNFWASWCIPCRDEAPLLQSAQVDHRGAGLVVVGIVFQDSAENARAFMARYGQSYSGLLDPDGRTALDYGVLGVPETFFIDRAGVIVSKQTGPFDQVSLDRQVEVIVR